MKASRCRCTTN